MNLKKFKADLKQLLKEYNVDLEVVLDGDTHGVGAKFTVYDKDDRKAYTLSDYSTILSANDLYSS